MNKDLKARIDRAPQEISVEITQRHIDLYKGHPYEFGQNPVAEALKENGWVMISIGVYECFIGPSQGAVPYVPTMETAARVHKLLTDGVMEPFTAVFEKKPVEAPEAVTARQQIYRDEEIAAFY